MADKANKPYSKGQTLTAASSAITQSQRFPLAMQEWHKLPAVARTWAAFKATLLAEQKTNATMEFLLPVCTQTTPTEEPPQKLSTI